MHRVYSASVTYSVVVFSHLLHVYNTTLNIGRYAFQHVVQKSIAYTCGAEGSKECLYNEIRETSMEAFRLQLK